MVCLLCPVGATLALLCSGLVGPHRCALNKILSHLPQNL